MTLQNEADYLGTKDQKITNPISGAWFRIEKGPESTPPTYEYDEVGVVIQGRYSSRPLCWKRKQSTVLNFSGEITLRDESGQTATVTAGDTFYFTRGSTITFSTNSHGTAWKCGSRLPSKI